MEKLKVAVIGVGSMGSNHARLLAELPAADLVAVADSNIDLAIGAAQRYGAKGYGDYVEMLEKERPDAVSVVVPTAMHEKVGSAALEAGAHVLIEKPIASTLQEGQRLVELAARVQRKLMVGHIVRFNPAIRALREKIQSNELGQIFQIICRRVGPFPARIRDVGVVIDLATHDIDVMRFLTQMEPTRVFAEIAQRVHTDHEDLVFGLFGFPNGMTAALEINWLTPTKVREVLVLGERGMFRVDDLTQDLYFFENAAIDGELWHPLKAIKGVSEGRMVRYAINRYEPLRAEIEAFLNCILTDTDEPISGHDGLEALRLALAIIESGNSHQAIEVTK
ncbi:MAG: Gfo/Idh/MocA family oxidoreductase [Anaerolineales bacterium]|nr:Gfo/Idh/MocA family oxidoreductase [Anaerolineales bacterium]